MGYIIALIIFIIAVIVIVVYTLRFSKELQGTLNDLNQVAVRAQGVGQTYKDQVENISAVANVQVDQAKALAESASDKSLHLQQLSTQITSLSNQMTYMKAHQWQLIEGASRGAWDYAKEEVPKRVDRQKNIFKRTFEKQKERFQNRRESNQ